MPPDLVFVRKNRDTNVLVIFTVTYGVNDIYHSNITILGTFLKVLEFVVENFKH